MRHLAPAVAISGNNVLVGALGGGANAVYLFDATSTGGQPQTTFQDPANPAGAGFGTAVAILGSQVLVGAPFDGKGEAYLFDAGTVTTFLNPDQGLSVFSNNFGTSVAIAGNDVVVGQYDNDAGLVGAADYLFDPAAPTMPVVTFASAGLSVAASGTDVLIGGGAAAYSFDNAGNLLQTVADPPSFAPATNFQGGQFTDSDPNGTAATDAPSSIGVTARSPRRTSRR